MKKIFFMTSFAGLLLTIPLKGQVSSLRQEVNPPPGQFYFGLKAGMNMARLTGLDSDAYNQALKRSPNPVFGVNGGLYAGYMITEDFAIQSEALISMQGTQYTVSFSGGDSKVTLRNTYVNIPVLAQYTFPGGIYLEAGPQFGFVVGDKMKVDEDVIEKGGKVEPKRYDLSLAGGLGYRFNRNWNVNLRYTYGLVDVYKKGPFTNKSTKNSVFQLGVGYTF